MNGFPRHQGIRRHDWRWIPASYSAPLAGPSGSGKNVLATEFIIEGARHDYPGIIAVFEKRSHP